MNKIIKNENQRIAILVDVQNLYYSAKNHFSSRINFSNLLKMACANRILVRAIAYVIKSDERETDFFDAVNNAGFEIREKDIQVFPDGSKKGDWDVGIVMDAIRLGEKVDSIILVSGDGDYLPMVTYLQQRFGCLVEVIAFDRTCSSRLKETADDFIDIEEEKSALLFKTRSSVGTGGAARRNKRSSKSDSTSRSASRKPSKPKGGRPSRAEQAPEKKSKIKSLFGFK